MAIGFRVLLGWKTTPGQVYRYRLTGGVGTVGLRTSHQGVVGSLILLKSVDLPTLHNAGISAPNSFTLKHKVGQEKFLGRVTKIPLLVKQIFAKALTTRNRPPSSIPPCVWWGTEYGGVGLVLHGLPRNQPFTPWMTLTPTFLFPPFSYRPNHELIVAHSFAIKKGTLLRTQLSWHSVFDTIVHPPPRGCRFMLYT